MALRPLSGDRKPPSESDIVQYAQDNLNRHKRGIFRKKFSLRDMLSWSKDPIRKPMIMTTDKSLKQDACQLFKLIQASACSYGAYCYQVARSKSQVGGSHIRKLKKLETGRKK